MASDTFTFSCPHCQTRLTVPVSLAGISGPCPSCRVPITAPRPEPATSPAALPEESPERKPAALPALPVAAPESVPDVKVAVAAAPEREATVDESIPAASGPRIRPEPRRLPDRPTTTPISTRRSTEDPRSRSKADTVSDAGYRPYRLVHLLFPVTFLALAATVVGALFYFFGPAAPRQQIMEANRPLAIEPPARTQPFNRPPQDVKVEKPHVTAAGPAPDEPAANGTGAEKSEIHGESPAIVAYAMLESFLHAKDAASRVDLVEPATSEQELAATLLKGPLPEFTQIFSELPQQHPDEKMTDFPYRVSFVVKDAPNVDFAILVRQRGTQPPRVFLPAFLDLVGGRLAAFTREPNPSPPTLFHVYLEPIDGCYEKEVPGADRKFTFKLLSSPFGKETARSYAANASRFRTLVDEPTYPIRWGMRRRATVTLQWNHREDPAKPFLELVDLNSPDWNP